jgi:uncharacterized protein (DUF1778 family)
MGTAVRIERISIRTDSETKNLLERAAESMHMTVSAYMLGAAQRQAREDLQNIEQLKLGQQDHDIFFSTLENLPEPNEALKNLMAGK